MPMERAETALESTRTLHPVVDTDHGQDRPIPYHDSAVPRICKPRVFSLETFANSADSTGMEQSVGQQIRTWRRFLGLSQTELGEWVGVSVDVVGRWERGEQEPRYSELVALVRAGVELSLEEKPVKPNSVTLYHGTDRNSADQIRKSGFNAGLVFLTTDRASALDYGGRSPEALAVVVSASDLLVDLDLPGNRALTVDAANEYSRTEGTIHDWLVRHGEFAVSSTLARLAPESCEPSGNGETHETE